MIDTYVPPGQRTSTAACTNKRSYQTYTASYRVLKEMLADTTGRVKQKPLLNAYRCSSCDEYHIGRKAHV